MIRSQGAKRSITAVAAMWIAAGLSLAAVVSRDLPKQLDLIDADNGGVVVYGTIVDSKVDGEVPGTDFPWTVLTVKVEQGLAPDTTSGELTVYSPGAGEALLSISPPETETRKGEKVVLFLSKNAELQQHAPGAYKIDSFAESFRTQKNRQGDVIILGEGKGSAIESNVKLSDFAVQVAKAHEAMGFGK